MKRRDFIRILALSGGAQALFPLRAVPGPFSFDASTFGEDISGSTQPSVPTDSAASTGDYHGRVQHNFLADGCPAHVVLPEKPLPGRPWVWRTRFWEVFQRVDVACLNAGLSLAYIDVGNTFGCPDAMKHFDVFYRVVRKQYRLGAKPALEGLSRGGLYAYRWAYVNTDKVSCIYGDAPVCDMKSWPGGKGNGTGSPVDWQAVIKDYHFSSEQEMMNFKGNPVDILAPIAAAHIPIIHVCGDADTTVPESENTDIIRKRYMALGGDFVLIIKRGCNHHPHGLADPSPVVNFVLAYSSRDETARKALARAPKPGSIIELAPAQWESHGSTAALCATVQSALSRCDGAASQRRFHSCL